ncbi:hypothetical protein FAVG1_10644 [Fusarium avenaceum]|nr:hypothetical protein FAVG1_10644 [Fusarium avenaceum]
MSKAIEARKRQTMYPILAGITFLGAGVYYLSKQPKENLPSVEIRGANGVIGAGGATTGNISTKLQSTFGTGGATAGVGVGDETKDTRVASNMTGLYTKREADLTAGSPLQLESTKGPKRPQFSFALGGRDDDYFITLEPQKPMVITHRFLRSVALEGDRAFLPGHKYRLEVREDEEAEWWRYGKKEDVMSPPGQFVAKEGYEHASGPPIKLGPIAPVEFEIEG